MFAALYRAWSPRLGLEKRFFCQNNLSVHVKSAFVAALFVVFTAACSPVFNWREVRFDQSGTVALLPCKPDRAERPVPLYDGSAPLVLSMAGCQAGGATFSVSVVTLPAGASEASAKVSLDRWQQATQTSLGGAGGQRTEMQVKGAVMAFAVQTPVKSQTHRALYAIAMKPSGPVIVQLQLIGDPQGGRDGPSALSAEAQTTFESGLAL
jgi:hypothetical protein